MEHIEDIRRQNTDSYMMITLNKQIEALSPIRVSYQNLQRYHDKIQADFSSLIEQHDYAICSLRSNAQNLSMIGMRNQAQRNDLLGELKNRQNDEARLILDTRNIAQKCESLNQKLDLETNRSSQNLDYKTQLTRILQTIKTHILSMENLNAEMQAEQNKLKSEEQSLRNLMQAESNRKMSLSQSNESLKCSIARINVKNDDLIDGNRKLTQQIRKKEEDLMTKIKISRENKQKLIQLRSDYQKLKNQIEYKMTLIVSENAANSELIAHENRLQTIISDLQRQKQMVQRQNHALASDICKMQTLKHQNIQFKSNSENHLAELKHANQLLLSQMEHYCIQDREIQNLLIRKISCLEFFSKKLNQKYEVQHSSRFETGLMDPVIFRQKSLNLQQLNIWRQKSSKTQSHQSKKDTKTSEKPWIKQNCA